MQGIYQSFSEEARRTPIAFRIIEMCRILIAEAEGRQYQPAVPWEHERHGPKPQSEPIPETNVTPKGQFVMVF